MEVKTRVYCTSVEETINAKEIKKSLKKIYPKYSIVIIPNKYATKKGKKEVQEYRKQYHLKNKDLENYKRRKYYYIKKGNQEKIDFYNDKINEILRNRIKN